MRIDVAGVKIDAITNIETLEVLKKLLVDGKQHYVVTPYSEQIVFALKDERYKNVLNQASLSLPDGIGILWAAKFLNRVEGVGYRAQILLNFFVSLFAIILNPKYIRSVIPEQVTGRRLVFDLIKLAHENNYSLALVGGEDNVAAQADYELKRDFPTLRINLALSGRSFDDSIVKEVAASNSDILLIAYSPPKQEMWIAENLPNLGVKLAIGLGGTIDYLAKKRPTAPNFVHYVGLEWLWRLITQPWRAKRIWNAVPVFAYKILRYKLNERSKS